MRKDNQRRTTPRVKKRRSIERVFSRSMPRHMGVTLEKSLPQGTRTKVPVSYLVAICAVVALVAGSFVFHLHVRFEGVKYGYEISQARSERTKLLVERRELRLELASLKAPERVEAEAREKLDMEMPDHRRIIPIGKKRRPVVASGGAR